MFVVHLQSACTTPPLYLPPPLFRMSNLTQHPSLLISPDHNPNLNYSVSSLSCLSTENEEERPSTPFVKRIVSIHLPHDQSPKELSELTPMLQLDLENQIMDGIPDLIKSVFPDNILPFHVDEALLNSLSTVYNPSTYKWKLSNAKTESVSTCSITKHCRNSQSL